MKEYWDVQNLLLVTKQLRSLSNVFILVPSLPCLVFTLKIVLHKPQPIGQGRKEGLISTVHEVPDFCSG